MTLEDRVTRLEDAMLRDIVTLLKARGDQLERIERAIRECWRNGQARA